MHLASDREGEDSCFCLQVVCQYAYRKDIPEAPSVYGTGKHHVALIGGEVEVRVVRLLQAGAPIVHLLPATVLTGRLLLGLGLCLLLSSLLKHFGGEKGGCHSVDLKQRNQQPAHQVMDM